MYFNRRQKQTTFIVIDALGIDPSIVTKCTTSTYLILKALRLQGPWHRL